MKLLFKHHGFATCNEKENVMCNSTGDSKTFHAYVHGALKIGCTIHFKFASLETVKYLPPNSTVKKQHHKNGTGKCSGCTEHGENGILNQSYSIKICQQQGK